MNNDNLCSDVLGTLAYRRMFSVHDTKEFPLLLDTKKKYLSLDAESSSVIHNALANPCNGLGCTIRCVAQDC